jgi:hypothetical protein
LYGEGCADRAFEVDASIRRGPGQDALWLDGSGCLVACFVVALDDLLALGEGGVDIALFSFEAVPDIGMLGVARRENGGVFGEGLLDVGDSGLFFVGNLNGTRTCNGVGTLFCNDEGKRLAVESGFSFDEEGALSPGESVFSGDVVGCQHPEDAGGLEGIANVELLELKSWTWTPDKCDGKCIHVCHVIAIPGFTHRFFNDIDARKRTTQRKVPCLLHYDCSCFYFCTRFAISFLRGS